VPLFYEDSLGAKLAKKWNQLGSADDELIDDPAALEAAQHAADDVGRAKPRRIDVSESHVEDTHGWVPVFDSVRLSGIRSVAGTGAFAITSALDAAGISYAWDPYPPEEMPAFRPAYGAIDRTFTLLVPPDQAAEARAALAQTTPPDVAFAPPTSAPLPARTASPAAPARPAAPRPPSAGPPQAPWPPEHVAWWRQPQAVVWALIIVLSIPILIALLSQLYRALTNH
jgi:hypothetical protein